MIHFKHTVIGYKKALASISISELEAGKLYALIGSNGSGKSTFLKTLSGQLPLIEGQLFIQNQEISHFSRRALATTIGYVPTKFPDAEHLRVKDFVGLGRTPYLNTLGHLSTEDWTIVELSLEQVNCLHLRDKFTTQLSDGEKQMVAIARALAQKTSIIILDEPTSFLDFKNKLRLLSLLERLSREQQLVIIYSTHDIEGLLDKTIEIIGIKHEKGLGKVEFIDKKLTFDQLIDQYYI